MKTQEMFNLKPGERLYGFTEEEIRMICRALENEHTALIDLAGSLVTKYSDRFPDKTRVFIADKAREINTLQFSIENREHDV